jgi:hypothetical protein
MGKNPGEKVCSCKPLLGHPQPAAGTLICSTCGFVAKLSPELSRIQVRRSEMEKTFKSTWGPEERSQYGYFLELMKPFETEPLQAARTAYLKTEGMRRDGTIERVRALAEAAARAQGL